MTRRDLVRTTLGAVAAGGAMPLLAAEDPSVRSAGRKIRFVSIGTGIRGCDLLRSARQVPSGVLVGIADLYDMHQQAGKEAYGADVPTMRDYRSLLDRKDVDAVIVAVTDHQHRRVVLDAVAAGKDVYCEKPMSHTVADGLEMVKAVQLGKRVFECGSQRVSSIVYKKAAEIYASGRLGEIHYIEGHCDRNSPSGAWVYPIAPDATPQSIDWAAFLRDAPERPFDPVRFFRWRCFSDYGEGVAGDLFVHLLSGIQCVTGINAVPSRASSSGSLTHFHDGRDFPDLLATLYDYPGVTVNLHCNQNNEAGEPISFYGKDATMVINGTTLTATVPTITTTAGKYNTVNFWMYWNGNIATVPAPFGFSSYTLYFPSATCFGFDMGAAGGYGFNPTTANIVNKWVMVTAFFYNGYYTSNSLLYINGTQVKSLTQCQGSAGTATASSSLRLGSWGGAIGHSFMQNSGSLANFQVYNSLLTPTQIQQLYIQGISGVPVSTNSLAGWWPLNGDASEVNYVRDSALTYPVATPLSPIPGVLSCTSSLVCGGNTIPELFLGYMPLASQGGAQTGYFDGVSTDVRINSLKHAPAITSSGGSVTLAAWAYSLDLNAGFRPIISYNEYNTPRLMLAYDSYCGSADVLSILYLSGTVDFDDCLPPAITTNTWIFYAVTYNGAGGKAVTYEGVGGKLYSDSVSYYSLYGNTIPANPPIDLGSSGGWYGGISNVQVYSAALSANQMRTLYYQGIDGMPFLGNLIGWWPLNGNANDSSGNGDVTWLQTGLTFPSIQGTYDSPGLSTVASPANEWQAIGLANT